MHRNSIRGALGAALAAVLLTGCGSLGVGDILGGGSDQPRQAVTEVRGTVRGVDTTGDCAIELTDSTYANGSYLRNDDSPYGNGGRDAVVYCDSRTEVTHQGRSYRPDALEPGDRVVVSVRESGGRLLAERIEVTHDVSQGGGDYDDRTSPGRYADLRGEVVFVDRDRRTLELARVEVYDREVLDARSYERLTLSYDSGTTVRFEGRSYEPESLERGDLVEVELDRQRVRGQLLADEVVVVDDVRAGYPR